LKKTTKSVRIHRL